MKGAPRSYHDAALHLLDRQLVDRDGQLVAKVDDLVLLRAGDDLVLSHILVGPQPLGQRIGGPVGRAMQALWSRLRADAEPHPGQVDVADVVEIGSAIRIGVRRADLRVEGLEEWVRTRVIEKLPGASHETQ